MFVACGIWCLADVSSVSPSSEQTWELWANQCLNSSCSVIVRVSVVLKRTVGDSD